VTAQSGTLHGPESTESRTGPEALDGDGAIRVVLVDDHAVITDGLSTLLSRSHDIEIVGKAGGGRAGVALCADKEPDVVLMDMAMPDMDGVEATRCILSNTPDTRVIFLTSYVNEEMVADAIAAGASGYLLKSIGGPELVETIRAVVNGRATLSREALQHMTPDIKLRPTLTERESDVLRGLAEGLTNRQIADNLELSNGTIRTYVSNILAKLGVENRTAAAHYAYRHKLL